MSFQCQHNNSDNVSLLGTHQSDGFNEHILNPRHFEVEIMNKREREERERERKMEKSFPIGKERRRRFIRYRPNDARSADNIDDVDICFIHRDI